MTKMQTKLRQREDEGIMPNVSFYKVMGFQASIILARFVFLLSAIFWVFVVCLASTPPNPLMATCAGHAAFLPIRTVMHIRMPDSLACLALFCSLHTHV